MSQNAPPSSPLNRPIRLAVLISGGGTTLVNFADQIADGGLRAEIPLVVASRPDCAGVERSRERGLKCEVLSRKDYRDVHTYSAAVFAQCRAAQADLVVLAGFLSLLEIPEDFSLRVMNIHPALIPAFCGGGYYGHHVHEAVLARGLKISGCTVHFADNEYDHGPIIVQKCVPVLDDDNPTTLAARVFEAECQTYPEAVRLFAEGRLEVSGRHVRVHVAR